MGLGFVGLDGWLSCVGRRYSKRTFGANKIPSHKLISGNSPIMEANNESEILLKDRLFPILVKEAMSSCECPAGINLNNANLCVCKN